MSDRDLSAELRQRLSSALNSGARLRAPLPSQARYAHAGAAPTLRARVLLLAAVATLVLGLLAVAGPQQPRVWIQQKVSKAIQDVGIPLQPGGSAHKSSAAPSSKPSEAENPKPGPQGNSEPADSPEPAESPDTSHSSQPGSPPSGTEPSPSPEPGEGRTGGGGSGGDHSPGPTPPPENG